MTAPPSTMAAVGRKRRPPPKAARTMRQRFARRLHHLAGDRTNKEIAAKVGVSPAAITKWFSGEQVPELEYWPSLAKALGVSHSRDLVPD